MREAQNPPIVNLIAGAVFGVIFLWCLYTTVTRLYHYSRYVESTANLVEKFETRPSSGGKEETFHVSYYAYVVDDVEHNFGRMQDRVSVTRWGSAPIVHEDRYWEQLRRPPTKIIYYEKRNHGTWTAEPPKRWYWIILTLVMGLFSAGPLLQAAAGAKITRAPGSAGAPTGTRPVRRSTSALRAYGKLQKQGRVDQLSSDALIKAGRAFEAKGDFQNALDAYKRAANRIMDTRYAPEAVYYMILIYGEHLKDTAHALSLCRKFLSTFPMHPVGQAVQRWMTAHQGPASI
ncbi:tetratricopeptide repeat protein [bacterium]|nr:tetratricopeptide repeat protein [bacterium]